MSFRLVLCVMGYYYVLTAAWPILHIKSFEYITGPKTDKWLVKAVSVMILGSGIIFILYPNETSALLAILNAAGLLIIDVYYSLKGVIRKVYLLDGIIEVGFIVCLIKESHLKWLSF